METIWIEIGGVTIRSPVNAGTNLLLAGQCTACFLALRTGSDARRRRWGLFFAMMGVATLAGVFKHGARHLLDGSQLLTVLAISNLCSGLAVYFAQRATIATHAAETTRPAYRCLADFQLGIFMAANIVLGPGIGLLIANTAVGLVPVIAIEAAHRRTVAGAGLVATGLSVSILTGLVYLGGFSLGAWLNHIDVAHLLMGISFATISRGVRRGRVARSRS